MTREEKAVIILKNEQPHCGEKLTFTEEERYEAYEVAIKALDQEPILDKIRAEIEQAADKQFQIAMGVTDLSERYTHIQMESAYRHSLNIIDKYRKEE